MFSNSATTYLENFAQLFKKFERWFTIIYLSCICNLLYSLERKKEKQLVVSKQGTLDTPFLQKLFDQQIVEQFNCDQKDSNNSLFFTYYVVWTVGKSSISL